MTLFESVILGLIQGLAEFLPISSSGHLAIFSQLFGLDSGEGQIAFSLLLHLGTLIAVFIVYYKDIWSLIKSAFTLLHKIFTGRLKKEGLVGDEKFVIWVIIATLPLVALKALGLDEAVTDLSGCVWAVGIILLFNGIVLFFSDGFATGKRSIGEMKWYNALAVGICQMFAVLPGLSRSGSTITGGLLNGLNRQQAVRFSFIVSIPAILGASVLEVPDLFKQGTTNQQLVIYLVGTAVAAVVGVCAIKLLNYISKNSNFRMFSYYSWLAGILAILAGIFELRFV